MNTVQPLTEQLELLREAKIRDVLGDQLDPSLEASGVLAKDGACYVIFDNLPVHRMHRPRALGGAAQPHY